MKKKLLFGLCLVLCAALVYGLLRLGRDKDDDPDPDDFRT